MSQLVRYGLVITFPFRVKKGLCVINNAIVMCNYSMTLFMPLLVSILKYVLVTKVHGIWCLRYLFFAYFRFSLVLIWHTGKRNQVTPRWNREAERSTGDELHIFTAGWVAGGEFPSEVSPQHPEKSECDVLFLNGMIAIFVVWQSLTSAKTISCSAQLKVISYILHIKLMLV